jgi:hypothetical protein
MALEKIRPRIVDETGNYTFNNVTATGNLVTLNANLGNVAFANYVKTDNLLYANGVPWNFGGGGGGATVAGTNTQVQFNDGGSFGSNANFVFDKSTNRLTVDNITANGAALTNLTGANISGTVANANFAAYAGNITLAAQSNITSLGTLTSLSVTGNISTGNANLGNLVIANFFSGSGNNLSNIQASNITGAIAYATTANAVAGSNVSGAVSYAATANAVAGGNVMGQVGNALVAGTVYTAAQTNITSVGTLTSLTVTGNITGGNANLGNAVTANYFIGNGALLTGVDTLTVGNAGFADGANYISNGTSNVNTPIVNGNITVSIGGVANTVVFTSTGMNVSGNITTAGSGGNLSGANYVIANYFTGTLTTAAQPNITSVGTLTSLIVSGNLTVSGTTTTVNSTTTRVVDPIFELGGGANGAALAADDNKDRGLLLHYYSGAAPVDAFIGWDDSNTEFAFGSNVTVTSEVTTFNSLGNVRANFFLGNGSQLTGVGAVSAGYIANGTSNVNIPASSGNITMGVAGNAGIVTVTGTGVNVSGTLTTTGNISVGSNYFVGNGFYLTGLDAAGQIANGTSNIRIPTAGANITFTVNGTTAANLTSSGLVLLGTGNITAGNVYANAGTIGASALTGTLSTANQYNVTNVGTLGNLAVTANITSGNVYANSGIVKGQYLYGDGSNLTGLGGAGYIFNGTSNVFISTSGGNVSFTVGGAPNILNVTTTGANIGGYANITGNLAVVANITSGNANLGNAVVANYFTGNFYGNANTAGTVITAAQPNITSVGTLTSLDISGTANLGTASNVKIGGGAADYFLKTDGGGNLSWAVPSGGGGGGGSSLTYTAATLPPATGNLLGDQWYNTTTSVLYEYISDGSASYWVDVSGATTTTNTGVAGTITIKDEGSNLTTAVTSINFVGAGVTASNVGNAVTVTVVATESLSPFLLMGA